MDDPPIAMAPPLAQSGTGSTPDSSATALAKPLVVRMKRKRLHAPIESIWLELSERPAKRVELDLGALSLNDDEGQNASKMAEAKATRLLFRHLDTVTRFGAEETTRMGSLLKEARDGKPPLKWKESRQDLMKSKAIAKAARFEQVWRSRKSGSKCDSMSEMFHLYDVIRMDVESDAGEEHQRREHEKREADLAEGQLLSSYLPLLKEYLPTAAAQLESHMPSHSTEDDYVYDIYALEEFSAGPEADKFDYPMVRVVDDDDFRWGSSSESEFDSEDSNDENNPINDYPDEEESDSEIGTGSEKDTDELGSQVGGEGLLTKSDGFEDYDSELSEQVEELWSDNEDECSDEK